MKNLTRMLGATLLEVMLVLAIASMIIVMSVKFYKSASDSNQVNAMMQTIQGITAACDGLAQNTGSYSGCTNANLTAIVGTSNLVAPWGSPITVTSPSATSANMAFTTPGTSVCAQLQAKLQLNPKYVMAACTAVVYSSIN